MATANRDNVSQPNNAAMQKTTGDSQVPDLNLEFSFGGIYPENSNQNPLALSSSVATIMRPQEPQAAPHRAVSPVRSVQLPRASSLPTEKGLRRVIRPKNVRALRRLETKQKIAQRQMSQQPAALPEVARAPAAPVAAPVAPEAPEAPAAPAAPATPAALAVILPELKECASNCPGALETVLYHYKAEGYLTLSRAANGAQSVETLPSQRNVTVPLMATSATAATTKEDGPSQSTPESPSKGVKLDSGDDMVSLRTTGVGGRQIKGILYARDGEVNILCVCHGLFHSPAQFVKHAGGEEVENPLRHIIVCPSSD
ncbi:ninja-family protein 6-like [Pyrus x bretschneideri]|uniref:ninja-family protein 6-like n=1 Tax=Pyrus x bretschneideri TaxID=225117 RepID=UPI0020304B5E|nr:ninja-family protein 6-like [Pyrus x bretschneideri]